MADNVTVTTGSYTAVIGSTDVGSGVQVQHVRQRPATAFITGNKSAISTSAVQLLTGSTALVNGIIVKADESNSGTVWVGISTVTAGTTDATDGYKLTAGESVGFQIDNANKVYVIGSAASQRVSWLGV